MRTILDITQDETAVTDASSVILEQNDYLPFGTRVSLSAQAYDPSNRYRFNGKEEQVTGNIGLTDYGARLYDNSLPRWTTPDPLAELQKKRALTYDKFIAFKKEATSHINNALKEWETSGQNMDKNMNKYFEKLLK